MTKYILHGGTKKVDEVYIRDYEFLREMLKIDKAVINILLCYFAKDPARWPDLLAEDQADFNKVSDGKELIFHVADEQLFADQLAGVDVLYLRGGDGHLIKNILSKTKNLPELFAGKIVGACSAGVNVLAKYYYDNDYNQIEDGLGILDIKSICHYDGSLAEARDRLMLHAEKLEMVCLPEDEYIIIES